MYTCKNGHFCKKLFVFMFVLVVFFRVVFFLFFYVLSIFEFHFFCSFLCLYYLVLCLKCNSISATDSSNIYLADFWEEWKYFISLSW